MKNDRRKFLKRISGVTAAVVAAPAILEKNAEAAPGSRGVVYDPVNNQDVVHGTKVVAPRRYPVGKYGLELDNVKAGFVDAVEGGNATADVIVEAMGPDHIQKKHIGNVKYDEVSFRCGTGMSEAFYNWLKDSYDRKHARKNGSVIAADFNYQEVSRLHFFNALITEIGMPALDASSKDAAKMTLKFKPELTRRGGGGGGGTTNFRDQKQKQWLPSNFRLRIDGLDEACSRVNKIEALTWKMKVAENAVGGGRDYEQEATSVEIPNLVITLPESYADAFYAWHEDFVIKGNCGDDQEKGGTLEYLAPDLRTVLFRLTFSHLGIFKIAPDKMEAGAEGVRRIKAEMYCEDMRFEYSPATL